jgi:hypothetical protein
MPSTSFIVRGGGGEGSRILDGLTSDTERDEDSAHSQPVDARPDIGDDDDERRHLKNSLESDATLDQELEPPHSRRTVQSRVIWFFGHLLLRSVNVTSRAAQAAYQVDDDECNVEFQGAERHAPKRRFRPFQRLAATLRLGKPWPLDEQENDALLSGDNCSTLGQPRLRRRWVYRLRRICTAVFRPHQWKEMRQDVGTRSRGLGATGIKVSRGGNISRDALTETMSAMYGVTATRLGEGATTEQGSTEFTPVLSGTIGEALAEARKQARLLVILIPAAKPPRSKATQPPPAATSDQIALTGFFSSEVARFADRKPSKASNGSPATPGSGSFLLWTAPAFSPEATYAIKRLKLPQSGTGGKPRPVLAVAYPVPTVDPRRGVAIVVPRLLAQHHCNPPPEGVALVQWLKAIKKRYQKLYKTMLDDLRESLLFQERQEGYRDSISSDRDRQERKRKEKEEKARQVRIAKEKEEALSKRRSALKLLLDHAEELDTADPNTKVISLRCSDGRSAQRSFSADAPVSLLFNWADVEFGMDRESLVLATMNGKQSFTWEDDFASNDDAGYEASETDSGDWTVGGPSVTLSDAGLGKMVGLRVSIKDGRKGNQEETQLDSEL